jgi:glycosyltransferase involved in cell wall biosynthesis
MQITIPNEYQRVGKFNVGVTAGIETTVCHPTWIEGINRMDLTLASSNFTKDVFTGSNFEVKNKNTGQIEKNIKVEKPVEVLFEGLDTEVYKKLSSSEVDIDLSGVSEQFAFLCIGHWMQGGLGHDRKNIGYTIKAFLETFKNKANQPALILKTQQTTSSIIDRDEVLTKIDIIKRSVKGRLPIIYLLHGVLEVNEIYKLYNHRMVKALVMLSKGEGFGRPMLEFAATGKPVIASNWSGHIDFLRPDFSALIPGELENVHSSAAVKDIILPEAQWYKPDDGVVGTTLRKVVKEYKVFLGRAKQQQSYVLNNFTFEHMKAKLKEHFTLHLPEFPKEIKLDLPKLNLPKLKKIG